MGERAITTFKFRLLPNRRQHDALLQICEDQRQLYNAALQERIDAYRLAGENRSYVAQCNALTEWRHDDPDAAATPLNIQRWTIRRLDEAYKSFFRRLRTNGKAGFPRFRGFHRWKSFGFNEFQGIRFDGQRLRFNGLPGGLRVHLHRPLPHDANIRSCVFRRDAKGWHVCFQVAVPVPERRAVAKAVGIDLGLKAFAAQSDGVAIPNPRTAVRAEKELRRRQRALARCKRRSRRRKKVRNEVARLHRKIVNTRTTWLHQQSARIARDYDLIAVEDLNVKGLAQTFLAKSIHDASCSKFIKMLSYKAERAGSTLIKVDPKLTTQACSGCGAIVRKGLADRVHSCPDCGIVLDRDHNAALNILHKGVLALGAHNVAGYGERAPGNITREIS